MTNLHLVFGGELADAEGFEFKNPADIDLVGVFPNYSDAERAWRAAAQRTVDSALTRYFIADLSKLYMPE